MNCWSLNTAKLCAFKIVCLAVCWSCSVSDLRPKQSTNDFNNPPNIIVILADDMGFSDAGFAGGEIATPNIDALAKTGVVLPNFYNSARCFPTRASLLTGHYHHSVGMGGELQMIRKDGGITPQTPKGPYQGYLDLEVPTLAELLRKAGYKNYMVGKWHLGIQHGNWPTHRGFDRYFGPVTGIDNYFGTEALNDSFQRFYLKDDQFWNSTDPDFYATDAFSDQAAEYVREHAQTSPNEPFFLYVAYTAPHWPLQAREEDIAKYATIYEQGWDKLREERWHKAKRNSMVSPEARLSARPRDIPAWDELSKDEKRVWARRMAVYAAMTDVMDQGVGRLVEALEEASVRENTLIVFFSDNGGASVNITNNPAYGQIHSNGLAIGAPGSADSVRRPWANVSNTPYKRYKGNMSEGGIKFPLVINWPSRVQTASIQEDVAHVIDLAPTFLSVAGGTSPIRSELPGIDLLPVIESGRGIERTLLWEHFGHRAIRKGRWKLVGDPGENLPALYDLNADPTEQFNILDEHLEKAIELAEIWSAWAVGEGQSDPVWRW